MSVRISNADSKSLSVNEKASSVDSKLLSASEPEPVLVSSSPGPILGAPASESVPETPAQKIELFLKLFRCRESVFPKLWESSG